MPGCVSTNLNQGPVLRAGRGAKGEANVGSEWADRDVSPLAVEERRRDYRFRYFLDPGGWSDSKWPTWVQKMRRSRKNSPLADMTLTAIPNEHPAWYDLDFMPDHTVEWLSWLDDHGMLFPDGRLRDPLENPQYRFAVDSQVVDHDLDDAAEIVRWMVIADGYVSAYDWRCVREAFEYLCAYCGKRPEKLTMDHVQAIRRGGKHVPENILPACITCNCSKNARDWVDFMDSKGDDFAVAAMARIRAGHERLAELRRISS